MQAEEFLAAARRGGEPPEGLTAPLRALWLAESGQWDEAHAICQVEGGATASWVHAHLHREEGDDGNAAYWYRRAGQPVPPEGATIAVERHELAQALLR